MNTLKFWAVFAVGVAAGAAVALIYAPQTGAKTRRQLKRGLDDASEYIRDTTESIGDHAEKVIRRSKDVVGDVVDTANNVVKVANTAVKKVAESF
jgi:gas vesicle protein